MEPPIKPEFTSWLFNQGPVVVILVIILIIGFKQFKIFAARQNAEIQKAWEAKAKADDDRFSDMKERFNASDRRHEECEKQKNMISSQLFQLACITGNTETLKPKPIKSPDEDSKDRF